MAGVDVTTVGSSRISRLATHVRSPNRGAELHILDIKMFQYWEESDYSLRGIGRALPLRLRYPEPAVCEFTFAPRLSRVVMRACGWTDVRKGTGQNSRFRNAPEHLTTYEE